MELKNPDPKFQSLKVLVEPNVVLALKTPELPVNIPGLPATYCKTCQTHVEAHEFDRPCSSLWWHDVSGSRSRREGTMSLTKKRLCMMCRGASRREVMRVVTMSLTKKDIVHDVPWSHGRREKMRIDDRWVPFSMPSELFSSSFCSSCLQLSFAS